MRKKNIDEDRPLRRRKETGKMSVGIKVASNKGKT